MSPWVIATSTERSHMARISSLEALVSLVPIARPSQLFLLKIVLVKQIITKRPMKKIQRWRMKLS